MARQVSVRVMEEEEVGGGGWGWATDSGVNEVHSFRSQLAPEERQ